MAVANSSIELSVMGAEEARTRTDAIKDGVARIRRDLMAMFVRQGWKALGYSSWHEYLVTEFPDTNHSYLRRQTHAALLEDKLGLQVGKSKEAHLRPLTETLGDDTGAKALAYYLVLDRDESPMARDFQRAAWEVYVFTRGIPRIRERMEEGELSPKVAYQINKLIENEDREDLAYVAAECSDPDLVPILQRLKEAGSATWDEILRSGTIPAFPNPIYISKATAHNLIAWLDVSSAEHQARAIEERREFYDARKTATDELVVAVRELRQAETEVALKDGLRRLYAALDTYDEASVDAHT
jgi:hypothetical protein